MRKSKLTLTADPSTIETAKRLAAARNTSVSALFSRLIESMQAEEETGIDGVGPLTRKASGLVSLPAGRSDHDLLADALLEKHGSNG
jgi:hypothetical protein